MINNVDLSTIESNDLVNIIDNDSLSDLNKDEIKEIFQEVNFDNFNEEELKEIALTLSSAPDEVKEAFEEEVDIYGSGAFDTYVPSGSTVSVATRRAVIAATAAISTVGVSTSSSSSSSDQRSRRSK